jgi:hypothetical protein
MPDLAEFETAPAGTELQRNGQNWQAARVGDILRDGDKARNTASTNYQVKLYPDACFSFYPDTTVSLSNRSGTIKYQDTNLDWHDVTSDGSYSAVLAIGACGCGEVSVVCGFQGLFRPRPWG